MEETKPTREYSNRTKCWLWTAVAVLCYVIPLAILLIIKRDKVFKDTSTSLSFFTILIIVFFLCFAKKLIKQVCKIITIGVFSAALSLIISTAVQSFIGDLTIISAFALTGAVLAWYPIQLSIIYRDNSYDEHHNLLKGLTFKEANRMLAGLKA